MNHHPTCNCQPCLIVRIEALRTENKRLLALIQTQADACPDCKGNGAYIDKDGMWERCFFCADLRDALAAKGE